MGREEEVKLIAYGVWEGGNCPDGRDCEHWLRAEAVWEEQDRKAGAKSAKSARMEEARTALAGEPAREQRPVVAKRWALAWALGENASSTETAERQAAPAASEEPMSVPESPKTQSTDIPQKATPMIGAGTFPLRVGASRTRGGLLTKLGANRWVILPSLLVVPVIVVIYVTTRIASDRFAHSPILYLLLGMSIGIATLPFVLTVVARLLKHQERVANS
jgi:hypothetical protein